MIAIASCILAEGRRQFREKLVTGDTCIDDGALASKTLCEPVRPAAATARVMRQAHDRHAIHASTRRGAPNRAAA